MSIAVTPGVGATVDADVIAGVNTQAVKLRLGATGVDGGLISAANPLPVSSAQAGTWTVGANATQTGTWSVRNQDGVGNNLASSTTAPAGTEQALIVRNIPSGTQTVSLASTTITGTVASAQSGAWTVTANAGTGTFLTQDANLNLTQAVAIAGVKGNLIFGSVTTAAPAYTTATANALSLTTAGGLRVDGSGVTQPVSGTVTITPPTGASATQIQGTVAHGAASAQNPVQTACETRTTNRTATADAQSSRPITDKLGRQIVKHGQVRELTAIATVACGAVATTQLIAAGAAGIFNDITFLMISVASVAAAGTVSLRDGATTVVLKVNIAATPAAQTFIIPIAQNSIKQAVAATAWNIVTTGAGMTADVTYISEVTT
jgi:hypothetical protein